MQFLTEELLFELLLAEKFSSMKRKSRGFVTPSLEHENYLSDKKLCGECCKVKHFSKLKQIPTTTVTSTMSLVNVKRKYISVRSPNLYHSQVLGGSLGSLG